MRDPLVQKTNASFSRLDLKKPNRSPYLFVIHLQHHCTAAAGLKFVGEVDKVADSAPCVVSDVVSAGKGLVLEGLGAMDTVAASVYLRFLGRQEY